jgi:hypothetical protein
MCVCARYKVWIGLAICLKLRDLHCHCVLNRQNRWRKGESKIHSPSGESSLSEERGRSEWQSLDLN